MASEIHDLHGYFCGVSTPLPKVPSQSGIFGRDHEVMILAVVHGRLLWYIRIDSLICAVLHSPSGPWLCQILTISVPLTLHGYFLFMSSSRDIVPVTSVFTPHTKMLVSCQCQSLSTVERANPLHWNPTATRTLSPHWIAASKSSAIDLFGTRQCHFIES